MNNKIILVGVTLLFSLNSYAILDTLKGHFDDAVSRFSDDQLIVENPQAVAVKTAKIDENAKGQDLLHNAKGDIYLINRDGELYVQLGENFSSSPGPDYYVYFSDNKSNIDDEADFDNSNQIELGKLIKGSGASYYKVDNRFNANDIKSVTIICKQYSEYIGSAEIN